MRTKLIVVIVLTVMIIVAVCVTFSACNKLEIAYYKPTPTEFGYDLDNSIPFVDLATAPVDNASRGFRGETYITLGRKEAYPGSDEDYMEKLDRELQLLENDDICLMQVYVYLIEYYKDDLPKSALDQLKEYLQAIEDRGLKILLRFAYETSEGQKNGPKTSNIQRHCQQLRGFVEENAALFDRTVYAVQMGLIGLWGEGHGSAHRHSVVKVAKAFADMLPDDVPLMARTPQILSKVPEESEWRFGMHEDYVIGYNDPWVAISTDDKYYQAVINKCKYAVTDGEMPWGRADIRIDMIGAIKTCVDFGMTSFSLAHNYIEEGKEYNLKRWKSEYLSEEVLKENKFPYNPSLLKDGKITAFNYLKYHLGYQLTASNLHIEGGKLSFMVTNFGFASPYGYEMRVYVDNKRVLPQEGYSSADLLQFCQKIYTMQYSGGEVAVEFVNLRDEKDKIKLFNDVPFVDGRNIICS